ncbi:MAG: Fe-S cluster assembly ATPase SufC [Candidatus Peribacteraceae bacterium]|nr:Fe-S cluster assembly ATPase SufC [Candidatus Peribacteraceae bacterium]
MSRCPPILSVRDLHVSIAGKEVVRGVSLDLLSGALHVIMGPNGAGKSTLVQALMGHPDVSILGGSAKFRGKNILIMKPHERAQAGLFLAFQHPRDIAGVTLRSFLFSAQKMQMAAREPKVKIISPLQFRDGLLKQAASLHLDDSFIERDVNKGFSGGERKKAELLQLLTLRPILALLDETDSGLDLDALRILADGLKRLRKERSKGTHPLTLLLVTHNPRFLKYLPPDHVHVMVQGKIVESGGGALARRLEREGFAGYRTHRDFLSP